MMNKCDVLSSNLTATSGETRIKLHVTFFNTIHFISLGAVPRDNQPANQTDSWFLLYCRTVYALADGRGSEEQRDRGERGERDVEGQRERRRRKEKAGKPPVRKGAPNDSRSTSSPFLPLFLPPSPLSHLRLVLLQEPARACTPGVVGHVQDDHALLFPADERAIRQALHHRQELLVTVVTR